ncbi:Hpt domain-containing protein [Galbibacter sp. BG1]|uniref:Hpt domain-containing protein n=1 Tax=Galbibacter sp. BG1 TaxID=1170699 RepID=UPI0015BEFF13|nr:Hpt domain-containing protein [Galbibacter sp. BG1]QLE00682.1 Hpt domain-containing protein [Galbibacter sp. BG1]
MFIDSALKMEIYNILIISNQPEVSNKFLHFKKRDHWNVHIYENSFSAIQYLKKNEDIHFIIFDEVSGPLNPFQLADYLASELSLSIPLIIIGEGVNEHKYTREGNLFLFVKKPLISDKLAIIEQIIEENLIEDDQELDEKSYSLEYLKTLSDNDEDFIFESLTVFKESVLDKLNECRESIENEEFKNVREIAHNIKPSFEMLENTRCKNICNNICYKATEKEIKGLFNVLEEEYQKIVKELAEDFPQLA